MILFTILLLMVLILVTVVVVATSIFGAVGTIVFGDVIVCVVLIGIIMSLLLKKRKK